MYARSCQGARMPGGHGQGDGQYRLLLANLLFSSSIHSVFDGQLWYTAQAWPGPSTCDLVISMKQTTAGLPPRETAILETIIQPSSEVLPKSVARYLMTLKFRPDDINRINALSAKARQ